MSPCFLQGPCWGQILFAMMSMHAVTILSSLFTVWSVHTISTPFNCYQIWIEVKCKCETDYNRALSVSCESCEGLKYNVIQYKGERPIELWYNQTWQRYQGTHWVIIYRWDDGGGKRGVKFECIQLKRSAQRRSMVHNVAVYRCSGAQRMSHKPM